MLKEALVEMRWGKVSEGFLIMMNKAQLVK